MTDISAWITLALIAFIAYKEHLAYQERKDSLDRLMSKNLQEYKDNSTTIEENDYGVEPDPIVGIEDAQEELVNGDNTED